MQIFDIGEYDEELLAELEKQMMDDDLLKYMINPKKKKPKKKRKPSVDSRSSNSDSDWETESEDEIESGEHSDKENS